jgi:hypothetical protein
MPSREKSQIPNSRKISTLKIHCAERQYSSRLIIEIWNLFGAWILGFGISPRLLRSFVALANREC